MRESQPAEKVYELVKEPEVEKPLDDDLSDSREF